MTQPASVRVTVYVAVDPITAFEIFTEEIDVWYRRGPHHFFDPARAAAIRFEPGVGGRLVEVYDTNSLPRLVEDQGLTVVECNGEPGRVRVLARS